MPVISKYALIIWIESIKVVLSKLGTSSLRAKEHFEFIAFKHHNETYIVMFE